MGSRSGLTLLEVLVALALMTVFIVSSIPLIRDATWVLASESPADGQDAHLLESVVDEFLQAPEEFAWDGAAANHLFASSDLPGSSSVKMTRVFAADPDVEHSWLLFEWSGQSTVRWFPPEDESVGDGEAPR